MIILRLSLHEFIYSWSFVHHVISNNSWNNNKNMFCWNKRPEINITSKYLNELFEINSGFSVDILIIAQHASNKNYYFNDSDDKYD